MLLAYTVTPEEDPLSCSTGSRSRESPRNDNDAEEDAVTAQLRDVPSEDDDDTDEKIVDIFHHLLVKSEHLCVLLYCINYGIMFNWFS